MTTPSTPISAVEHSSVNQGVQPIDIIAGLGAADRKLLAVSLALFDDSTLSRRVKELADQAGNWVSRKFGGAELEQAVLSVETRMAFWRDSTLSDDDLRLTLWIYLREAFGLAPRLTLSTRGAEALAVELAAAAIHVADPPDAGCAIKDQLAQWGWHEGDRRYTSLADVVQPVLRELMSAAFADGASRMDCAAQDKLIAETRARLQGLSEADQQRLLEMVGAQELNDAAVRQILLTGGGLTAFSAGVGMAGFSAYILAAQASAFIPLVSGPALVSTVAVLSNPVTVVAATAAALWWFSTSTNDKVRTSVALRVVSLLALQGLSAGRCGVDRVLASFKGMQKLRNIGDIDGSICEGYRRDWRSLIDGRRDKPTGPTVAPQVAALMRRPAAAGSDADARWRRLLFSSRGEEVTAAAIAGLTLGDIAYSAAAIDPTVIAAADFARLDDLSDPIAFAGFAAKIESLAPGGALGALGNVKGYVAERVVAAELVAQGHQVEFPASSIQEGWDLLVDGQPFQVKCLADAGGLVEHFEKNPDIPVLVNAELADHVPPEWADKVFFVEGYSNELITNVSEHSLAAGADVLEPDVPLFAIGVIAARNLVDYRAGKVSGAQAIEQIVLDGGTRAGLAAAGGFIGQGIGLLVFGPAGALVLGAVIPLLSQAQASRARSAMDGWVQPESYQRWEGQAHQTIDTLLGCLKAAIEEKTEILRGKYKAVAAGGVGDYVRSRLLDEALYLHECLVRIQRLQRRDGEMVEQRALAVIRWTAGATVHPMRFQTDIESLNSILAQRPPLTERFKEVAEIVAKKTMDVGGMVWDYTKGLAAGLRGNEKS